MTIGAEDNKPEQRRRGGDVVVIMIAVVGAAAAAVYFARSGGGRPGRAWAVLFGFGLFITAMVALAVRHTLRQKADFAAAVTQLGLETIVPSSVGKEFGKAWSILPDLMRKGKIHAILVGELDGLELTIFEHRFTTMAGNTPVTISHSVYSIPVAGWPETHIVRPTLFSKVSSPLKKEFEVRTGDAAFDAKFKVRCRAPDFPGLILHERVRLLMMKNPRIYWRVVGDRLCMIEKAAISGKHLANRIALFEAVWGLMPESVRGVSHAEYEVVEG